MHVEKLVLKNFRNFCDLEICFKSGLTVITGQNGAGKTNLLEALYLCSIGRSPRTRQDGILISRGKGIGQVLLEYKKAGAARNVGVHLSSSKGKSVILDGAPSGKISDIVGNFGCVYFSPDEINIVRGGPQYRRRFMDIINCQISKNYLNNLKSLQHCLKQRNAILRGIKLANNYDNSLDPWDDQIVKYGMRVMMRRQAFIRLLQKIVDVIMRILTDGSETLKLTYRSFCERLEQIHIKSLADEYNRKVRLNYVKDVLTHSSSVGPHLDDFDIRLVYLRGDAGGHGEEAKNSECINLRTEGSLGQQRTATIALKLAEIFIYQKFYGEKPVLLLDDVFGELDFTRRQKLMEYCRHFDTIVTCTEWSFENPMPDAWYEVRNGEVVSMPIDPERFTYRGEFNARALDLAKKINEMAGEYCESQAWVEPVRNRALKRDVINFEECKKVQFSAETVMNVLEAEEERIVAESIDFDPWNDEQNTIEKSRQNKK